MRTMLLTISSIRSTPECLELAAVKSRAISRRLRRRTGFVLALSVLASAGTAAESATGDWPNFRGPNHDGISGVTGYKKDWNQPIPMLWDRTVGSAFSSFACIDGRVYTGGTENGKQTVTCLDATSGKVIWTTPFAEEYPERQGGDGPRATPTFDDRRIYMLGARGKLVCLDADNGREMWSKQFNHMPKWGYSGSVLVEGDLAITSAGEDEGALVAYDKTTGELKWKCGDAPAGYSTPYPFTFDGARYVVGFAGNSVIIAELKTGRKVWSHSWETSYDVNAAAPIYHNGHLFVSSGYRTGCGLFKLHKQGDELSGELVWKSEVLMNKFQSCILYEGNLYSSDQNALVCVDFMTGEEKWRERRAKDYRTTHGTLVLADGYLIHLSERGLLQIAPATPEGWNPVTEADLLSGRCWTVPVLHEGRLYVRNLERVACFNLKP